MTEPARDSGNGDFLEESADLLMQDPHFREAIEEILMPTTVGKTSSNYPIQKLGDVHKEIIRLKVQGVSTEEISKRVGLTTVAISGILRNPLARKEINRLHGLRDFSAVDATARLDGLVDRAISVYESVISGEEAVEPMDRVKVASEILDRTGFGRVSKVEGTHRVHVLTGEDVLEIKAQALERARECGRMIDVTPEESEDGLRADQAVP